MRNEVRQDKIVGSRRFSNYFWSFFSICWEAVIKYLSLPE
jgi:hypothetical protein